jgi:hypothetical protein
VPSSGFSDWPSQQKQRYFRTVTSVAHFRVIASEVAFGVNFLAISLETLRCAQQLTKLFMFLYQKGVRSQKCSHQVALSAVHWQVAPLHQPLSPTTSSVVPGVSSSPCTFFPKRHFWGAVRTSTLATVQRMLCSQSKLKRLAERHCVVRMWDVSSTMPFMTAAFPSGASTIPPSEILKCFCRIAA